jgi:hypothetical protein
MSRLVVPYPTGPATAAGTNQPPDTLQDRVVKYVPVETVGLFVAVNAALEAVAPGDRAPYLWAVAALCLIGSPIYFLAGFRDRSRLVRIVHAIVSVFAFLVWAYTLAGDVMLPGLYNPIVAAILLPAFSYIVGAIATLYGPY